MSLSELQGVLAKILTDEALRQSFVKHTGCDQVPEEFRQYGLTLSDWDQLRAIRADRLKLYAHLLYHKRIEKVSDILIYTFFLLGADLERVTHTYCQECPPSSLAKLIEAHSFYLFLAERASAIEPPYVKDVALYEITLASFTQKKYSRKKQPLQAQDMSSAFEKADDFCCIKSEGLELKRFDYDLELILPFLQRRERPPEQVPEKSFFLFQGIEGQIAPRPFKVTEDTINLLDLCDGSKSIAEIVDDLADAYDIRQDENRNRFQMVCFEMLEQLNDLGIVEIRHRRR